MKKCTKCKIQKPLSDYYKRGKGKKERPECKKCTNAHTKHRRKKSLDGYWRVYKLPNEDYVGISSDLQHRINSHRSAGKNVNDIKILAKYKRVEWAIIHEAIYHLLGYGGCHLTPNKVGKLITIKEIEEQLYERNEIK